MTINYTEDCGSADFTIWNFTNQNFGLCFFRIFIELPFYGLFAISSAYYTGKREITYSVPFTWNSMQSLIIYLRSMIISLLVLNPVVEIMTDFSVFHENISVVHVCIVSFKSFAWILHLLYTLRLKRGLSYNTRGPKSIILIWFLIAFISIMSFRSHYEELKTSSSENESSFLSTSPNKVIFHTYVSGAELLLQFLYFLTIIPSSTHLEQRHYQSILVDGANVYESHSILNHESNSFVGFHEEDEDPMSLGVAKENASWLSKLSINWVNPLMMKGSCGYLRYPDDLFELPSSLSTSSVSSKFQQSSIATTTSDNYSLVRSLRSSFGWEFYSIGILRIIGDGCGFAGPILLNLLVSFIEEGESTKDDWHGYAYVAGMFISSLIGALANTHFNMFMMEVTIKMRAAVITSVYRKTLLLRQSILNDFNTGEIINYMSTDTNRIINFCPSFHALWSLPIQIIVSLYLLYQQIGLAFLAGITFAILLIPINKWIANKIGDLSTKMMHFKDTRTNLLSEILYGIRVIKFHSWEHFFTKRVNEIREQELKNLKGRKYLDALCVYFWATTPVIVSVLSFGTYILLGNELTAAKVFTSLALFNMLITPLNALPWVINGVVESWVSVKRISKLLKAEVMDSESFYSKLPPQQQSTHEIVIKDASFDWGSSSSDRVLIEDLNVEIKKGQFVGVIGEVGCAKTSLLMSILGELKKTKGTISLAEDINGFGVVSQDAWIQRGTIRRNILFGNPYNMHKYNEVIVNCCLNEDLDKLEFGEDTVVGENGMTLSGGQKQRIALARAIYHDEAVYLLDDIFSAVDLNVGKQLYRKCILGSLKYKTRIVCTHQPRFLRDADLILVMDGGKIINRGSPNEILPIFFDDDFNDDSTSPSLKESFDLKEDSLVNFTPVDSIDPSLSSPPNRLVSSSEFINKPEGDMVDENEEKQEEGTINISVYKFYMSAIGKALCVLILLSLLAMQGTKNSSDIWLSHWVSNTKTNSTSSRLNTTSITRHRTMPLSSNETYNAYNEQNVDNKFNHFILLLGDGVPFTGGLDDSTKYYFTIFILIGFCNTIVTFMRAFLFAYGGIKGGKKTHTALLRRVLKAKITFFDTTPIGRIINRFSSDVYNIDDSLPFTLNILLAQVYGVIGTLVITSYALPWILILILPLMLVVHNIMQYYRLTARQLRRLSNISLSPIYAHFSETLKGLVTIRAMNVCKRFEHENEVYLEANQRCNFSTQAISQWLGFRLQMVGLMVITGAGFIGAVQHRISIAEPGLIGLAISYALTLTNSLSSFVAYITETEKEMISVERAYEYITCVEEESRAESRVSLPYSWPSQGVISFNRVSLRYREELPYALKNISFEARPCEKIGILGRTGSGKSSLFQAMFRMVDNFEGEIIIDTVNIKHINLKVLRSKMWIIPQDPLIFSGTLRENLDPKGVCTNDEILESAIRKCQLTDLVRQIGGIDGDVGESGRALSAGQKQLVCLARALLVNPTILCIDEATASCDLETDKIIQSTISTSFRHTTILTVAHRINTILNSDRVIVMDDGQIVEIDAPEKLILDKSSHFFKLAQGYV